MLSYTTYVIIKLLLIILKISKYNLYILILKFHSFDYLKVLYQL